jgi:hypothetical protein
MKYLIILGMVLFIGCEEKQSPSEIYLEYNQKVIAGLTFENEKEYFSKNKILEVESSLPRYMKQMNKTEAEVLKFAQDFAQSVARCKEINLTESQEVPQGVKLVYSQKDICGNSPVEDGKQIVIMTNENGWKINSIEIHI